MTLLLLGLGGCLFLDEDDLAARQDTDGDGVLDVDDCAPDDPAIYPGAEEICGDGLDNDCDGGADACRFLGERTVSEADVRILGAKESGVLGFSFLAQQDAGPDGADLLAAGAPGTSSPDEGLSQAGEVLVFLGPLEGTLGADGGEFARIIGHETALFAGWALAPAGDLTGDGFADLLVGAPGSSEAAEFAGGVWIIQGPLTEGDHPLDDFPNPLSGHGDHGAFGATLAGGLDVSGDGRADVLVGEPSWSTATVGLGSEETQRGSAWLYSTGADNNLREQELAEFYGGTDTRLAGAALDLLPDIDGDGQDEVLIGAWADQRAGLFAGAAALFQGPVEGRFSLGAADTTLLGSDLSQAVGFSVGPAGDVDGDGLGDWFAGAPAADDNFGRLVVMTGAPRGDLTLDDAAITVLGDGQGQNVGVDAATLGDFDGDGQDDLALGLVGWSSGASSDAVGAVCLLYGPLAEGAWDVGDADACIRGEDPDSALGLRLGGAQDLDGDAWPDLVASAAGANIEDEALGAIYIFSGGAL